MTLLTYIYSVFNSRGKLLATFSSFENLKPFIRKNSRCEDDTRIIRSVLDSWGDFDLVSDVTNEFINEIYKE